LPLLVRPLVAALLVLACVASTPLPGATVDRYWEYTPYNVQMVIVLDTSTPVRQRLAESMPRELDARARVAYGALWKLSTRVANGADGVAWGRGLELVPADQLAKVRSACDKLLLVVIRETIEGYEVSGTEYDCLLELWGTTVRNSTSDLATVEELAFAAVLDVFSPVAQFNTMGEDREKVEIRFRGSALPRSAQSVDSGFPQQILKPFTREVDREGLPLEEGINPVNWTYLAVDSPGEDKNLVTATVYSHARSPFGARRRGRVEQLALAVKPRGEVTQLRLHSGADANMSLAGFEVHRQNVGEKDTKLIGKPIATARS
jgi:hypothetical protein